MVYWKTFNLLVSEIHIAMCAKLSKSTLGHDMILCFAMIFCWTCLAENPQVWARVVGRVTCRHHRYIFEEKKGKDGAPQVAARLQELGPRFTLKLQSLQVSTRQMLDSF